MKCDIPLMSPIRLNRRHGRERLREERGQTFLEFALVLPLLLILIFGVIDLGKALGYKNDETNIANQAARLAVVSGGTDLPAVLRGPEHRELRAKHGPK